MSKISFPTSLAQALKGQDHVALFASKRALRAGAWKKVFKGKWSSLVGEMVKDLEPGTMGRTRSTYTGVKAPRRVTLAVLPNAMSRHASPTRSDAIGDCAARLDLSGAKKAALVVCLDKPEHFTAAANALGRAFPLYSRAKNGGKGPNISVVAIDAKGNAIKPQPSVERTVESTRFAASLVDRPAAELSAADFVSEARKAIRGVKGVKVSVIVGNDLTKKKLNGIHSVGRAAKVAPRLLVLEHGAKKRGKATVALVGKGILYDTGGLNIKTGGNMYGMKTDMGGGAAVLGAFRTLIKEKLPHRLVCLVPLAENAVGPDSYRPDDILAMHSGKTVEINNTDAEGRILLADAVSYAARVHGADVIIDAATLTGAQLISTGKRHAAVVSNRGGLEGVAVKSGLLSGDLAHPLPFAPEFYQSEFKSAVADMRNSVKDRYNAQSSCAGQFVYSHIQELNVPWLHIDLAGPAHPGKRATGFGVALIAEVVRSVKQSDLRK